MKFFLPEMKSFLRLLTAFIFLASTSTAGTLKGRIMEKKSGEPATGARISIEGMNNLYDVAGLDGSFTISNIPDGKHKVIVSYTGYTTIEQDITINEIQILNFALEQGKNNLLQEV